MKFLCFSRCELSFSSDHFWVESNYQLPEKISRKPISQKLIRFEHLDQNSGRSSCTSHHSFHLVLAWKLLRLVCFISYCRHWFQEEINWMLHCYSIPECKSAHQVSNFPRWLLLSGTSTMLCRRRIFSELFSLQQLFNKCIMLMHCVWLLRKYGNKELEP